MSRLGTAKFEARSPLLCAEPLTERGRCEIVASVAGGTGPLVGVDAVLISAASTTLRGLARLRRRYRCPAILELPGHGTQGVLNPLTTSELLVFASAEGFHTVCLSGVCEVDAMRRARELLHPGIRLAISLSHPAVSRESLGEICGAADLVLVDQESLTLRVGPTAAIQHAHWALLEARSRGVRCLLAKGLLPSLESTLLPSQVEIDRISSFLEHGIGGFVLGRETERGAHPQEAIDLIRSLSVCAQRTLPRRKQAARVAGQAIATLPTRRVVEGS